MRIRKWILSTLLALCVVLGMLPGAAWAAEVEDLSTPMDVFDEEPGIWEKLEEPAEPAAQVDGPISGTCGENATWTLSGGTLTISGSGPMDAVYDFWANQGRAITSVVINSGITSIGERAFWGCSNLTNVTIPDSVTNIEGTAFHSCTSLTDVTIPDSVTSIKGSAFYNCTSLTSVFIPSSVIEIDCVALFDKCSGLTAIQVDRKNPNYASMDGVLLSKNLDTLLIYPGGKQGSYSIPNSVTSIDYWAFADCTGLTDVIIPNSVTSIRGYAFYGCTSLTEVTIPDSVTSIGSDAFRDCASLTDVTIPDSVTLIAGNAFLDCASLTSVFIPSSVMKIGTNTFSGCSSLTAIQVDRENPIYASMDGVLLSKKLNTLLSYPGGKQGSYSIPDSVTSIEKGAFAKCTSLTEVIIPNSVTDIRDYAFYGCTGLTDVITPKSVTSIGERAFDNCTNLTDVTILDSVTGIGEYAFRGCTNLTDVTIPDSVTSIGAGAFFYCPGLTDVYYGGSESEWEDISIGIRNECLTSATIHYNSTGPDTPATEKVRVDFFPNGGTITSIKGFSREQIMQHDPAVPQDILFIDVNSGIAGMMTDENGIISDFPVVEREGYTFDGWWYTHDRDVIDSAYDGAVTDFTSTQRVDQTTNFANFVDSVGPFVIAKWNEEKPGDLTGDGEVAANDVLKLARAVLGSITLTEQESALGDVDGDGSITARDVLMVARYVLGSIDSL